jgi:cytochrome c-type biogenesis protein CcmH
LGAALALGLAGYAAQASPGLRGAPAAAGEKQTIDGTALIAVRRQVMGRADEPLPPYLLTADAFARRGQYQDAAGLLRRAVREHPRDAEAWLALGNALVEHGEGTLSPAALYAYRQADAAQPGTAGPSFFLGLALIRQGEVVEAHKLWSAQLAAMPADAPGRNELAARFGMLDAAMRQIAAEAANGQSGR